MSSSVSVHRCSSERFQNRSFWLKLRKEIKTELTKVLRGGKEIKRAINLEERLLILWGIQQHRTGQARLFHMEPSLGGMSVSFGLIFCFFLSPVSWTPGCLIQQQRGRSSWARRRGLSVEHEVQEGHTGVRLPLSGTQNLSLSLPSWVASSMTSVEHRQNLLSHPSPIHIVSSPSWHPPPPHLCANTCFVRRPEKTCGAGAEWNLD